MATSILNEEFSSMPHYAGVLMFIMATVVVAAVDVALYVTNNYLRVFPSHCENTENSSNFVADEAHSDNTISKKQKVSFDRNSLHYRNSTL